ncbi:hypothetical protein V1524DRAFT_479035 [Lipomyces starkeyi]
MPGNRSLIRNVHFFDGSKPDDPPLGGLYLNPSVTKKKFYQCGFEGLKSRSLDDDEPLESGHYDIVTDTPGALGRIWLTGERYIARSLSRTDYNRAAFIDEWTSFEAAHIFPLSHEELFRSLDYPQYVTNRCDDSPTGICSCQNGLLMRSNIHQQFDSFNFAVDPDDDYKITCFRIDLDGIDGRTLDPVCRDPHDEKRVIVEFLRWHFCQTVLANMKANGEPIFEFDFPDGSDMVGEILSGPRAAERMEAELFSRLPSVSPIS